VRLFGIGLHTGALCSVAVHLDREALGFEFHTDAGSISATLGALRSTELCTTLRDRDTSVSTVEHLLAALAGLGHFSATIRVEGPEVPILDGSARPFVMHLDEAASTPDPLAPDEPFDLVQAGARVRVEPSDALVVDYTIEFDNPFIGRQRLLYVHSPAAFREQIAPARTFTSADWVGAMRDRGLIRGGSLDCAVVFGPQGPINPPLRFPDEPVRHKILDLLGDLALLGRPLHARLTVERGGHTLHAALVGEILSRLRSRAEPSLGV
jgi:UDP-3-O-[3-hydroxymyristoyl] N-acetylglucosamine deacetylase